MKKRLLLFPFIAALVYVVLTSNSAGPGSTSGVDATGASGAAGCSCHNPTATPSTNVSVQLLSGGVPVTTYTPGGSYTIRVSGTNTGATSLPRFGFQLSTVKFG